MAVDATEWHERMERGLKAVPGAVRSAVGELLTRAARQARARAPSRSSRLRRSIKVHRHTGERSFGGELRSDHPAAGVLDKGGTVRGSPWLAIPLRESLRRLEGPRADPVPLFTLQIRGRLYLASKRTAEVRWALRREVRMPRLGFLSTALADAGSKAPRAALTAIDRHLGAEGAF